MKAIFYASSTGNTEHVAKMIRKRMEGFDLVDVASEGVSKMSQCDSIIIGVSTWGEGDLQDDWEDCFDELQDVDLANKNVALFGLGDQESYSDEFVNALGTIYDVVSTKNANIVGFTSTEDYEFDDSTAVRDEKFVGLVIDEDNQSSMTKKRIENWIENIKTTL